MKVSFLSGNKKIEVADAAAIFNGKDGRDGIDGKSITIVTFTDEALFDSYIALENEFVVLTK